jgi:hypothetical protein
MFATANVVGTPSISFATGATSNITNLDGVGHHLHIDVVAWGFTMPITPPVLNFDSQIGGSVFVGNGANTLSFLSCVDQANGGGSAVKTGCPGTYQAAALTPNVTGSPNKAYSDETVSLISPLSAPYALDEQFDFWIGGNSKLNFSASTTLTPVPEPMSIVLLGGVVLLTSRLIRRKQNQVS